MENIRPPDKVIKQKLIDYEDDSVSDAWFKTNLPKPLQLVRDTNNVIDEFDEFEYDLEKAIEESIKDFKEGDFLDEFLKVCNSDQELKPESEQEFEIDELQKKKEILPLFKSNILRLIPFDKELKKLWEKISPIIELYQNDKIDYHLLDSDTYKNLFTILKSVRISKEEWSILETIFIKQID